MKRHLPFALATLFVVFLCAGCSTTHQENYQQRFDDELEETTLSMRVLTAMDLGDVTKARKVAEAGILLNSTTLPYYAAKSNLGPGQKQKLIVEAKQILDYMEKHKDELSDTRRSFVRGSIHGLQRVLTEPEDVRRLQELSDYFAAAEKK